MWLLPILKRGCWERLYSAKSDEAGQTYTALPGLPEDGLFPDAAGVPHRSARSSGSKAQKHNAKKKCKWNKIVKEQLSDKDRVLLLSPENN